MKRRLLFLSILALSACGGDDAGQVTVEVPEVVDAQALVAGCVTCHGRDGATSRGGAPFLAGQHAPYMVSAIRDYVVGNRLHADMREAVVELTDAEREAVAGYFAGLDTPWRGAAKARPASVQKIDRRAVAAGKRIARQCTSCHGDGGISTRPGVPNLAGLQPDYFKRSLRAYLDGERTGADIMKNFKYSLSARDIDNLAAYFASLPLGKTTLTAKGSLKWGRKQAAVCVGCHGAKGNSINPDIPSLAGQNGRYLMVAMKHYRDGERRNTMMRKALAGYSDQKIANLAAYFSRQTPAPPGKSTRKRRPGEFDPIADGAELAASCDGCHGSEGNGGVQRGIPRLTGQAPQYLFEAVRAYRDGGRHNETMKMFTVSLDDVAIEKVSLFYATREPTANQALGKGEAEKGAKIAEGCAGCHGEQGVSADPKVPSLAGQDAAYLVRAIRAYAAGERDVEAMTDAVRELDGQSIEDVATYYAALPGRRQAFRLPESPQAWAEKCERCHGPAGYSPFPDKPILTGQLQSYLYRAMIAYRLGERRQSTMNAMLGDMTLSEIEALAAHYARQERPETLPVKGEGAESGSPAADGGGDGG